MRERGLKRTAKKTCRLGSDHCRFKRVEKSRTVFEYNESSDRLSFRESLVLLANAL